MSSIHYKFKATLDYKTFQFDGLHISADELKRAICAKEGIRMESFDLILSNAHSARRYEGTELVPRNSSVVIQRVPREGGEKPAKIQPGNSGMIGGGSANGGGLSGAASTSAVDAPQLSTADFEKMSEEEKLAHIKDVSTSKYRPENFQRRTASVLSGPPPPTYTCNRCQQPGHWYKSCPMLSMRRTTGIPSEELKETTADDPLAMVTPSGKYVVHIMHWKARQQQQRNKDAPSTRSPAEAHPSDKPPRELTCPLCGQLFKDAVLTVCCGDSFCSECIESHLMESETRACPGTNCKQQQVLVTSLVPNARLRQTVDAFLNGRPPGSKPAQNEPPASMGNRVSSGTSLSALTARQQEMVSHMSGLSSAELADLSARQENSENLKKTAPPAVEQKERERSPVERIAPLAPLPVVAPVLRPAPAVKTNEPAPPGLDSGYNQPAMTSMPSFVLPHMAYSLSSAATPMFGGHPLAQQPPRPIGPGDAWDEFLRKKDNEKLAKRKRRNDSSDSSPRRRHGRDRSRSRSPEARKTRKESPPSSRHRRDQHSSRYSRSPDDSGRNRRKKSRKQKESRTKTDRHSDRRQARTRKDSTADREETSPAHSNLPGADVELPGSPSQSLSDRGRGKSVASERLTPIIEAINREGERRSAEDMEDDSASIDIVMKEMEEMTQRNAETENDDTQQSIDEAVNPTVSDVEVGRSAAEKSAPAATKSTASVSSELLDTVVESRSPSPAAAVVSSVAAPVAPESSTTARSTTETEEEDVPAGTEEDKGKENKKSKRKKEKKERKGKKDKGGSSSRKSRHDGEEQRDRGRKDGERESKSKRHRHHRRGSSDSDEKREKKSKRERRVSRSPDGRRRRSSSRKRDRKQESR